MPPGAAPLSMKIIPLRWRGAGVGCSGREGPTPRRLRPSALPRGDFQRSMTLRIATSHENEFPFQKGCKGMSCREPDTANPKDSPPRRP